MSYTKNRSMRFLCRVNRTGKDWNGDHQTFNARRLLTAKRTRTGDSNRNWRKQVNSGQNATTDMVGIYDTYDATDGAFAYRCQQPSGGGIYYSLTVSGDIALYNFASFTPFDWVPISTSVAYNRGLTQYLKNVNRVNQKFSGMVFLGELRETLRMIRRPAEGIRNILEAYVIDLKRKKRKSPKNWKKNLSSAWLEYAFGMVPLISDLSDASKAYNDLTQEPGYEWVRSVGVEEKAVPSRTYTNVLYQSEPDIYTPAQRYTLRSTDKAVVVFKGLVRRETRATPMGKAAVFGFSPEQFIPTVWELLPWSFLIDYFSNVGDVLEAGVTNQGTIAFTNVTEIKFQIMELVHGLAEMSIQSGSKCTVINNSGSTVRAVRRTVNRRANVGGLGVPSLSFEIPGRPAQWANMTALFAQVNSDIHPQRFHR